MKKSNLILIIFVAVCIVAIFGTIIASRIVLTSDSWVVGSSSGGSTVLASSQSTTEVIEVEDFTGVATSGSWEIEIRHGSGYLVEVKAPENIHKHLDIWIENGDLRFQMSSDTRFRGSYKPAVVITMPLLYRVTSSGLLELTFAGFDGELFSLHSSGVSTITGEDSSFEFLSIEADGVANLTFEDTFAGGAYVDMGGVGSALLNLGPGELKGRLGGVYQLSYRGTPSLVDVDAGGLAKVSRIGG